MEQGIISIWVDLFIFWVAEYRVRYKKIIFICTTNTCRGPMAEMIYKKYNVKYEMDVVSRGLVVLFPEPPNPKVEIVLKMQDIELEHYKATALSKEEINKDTLVLALTEKQKNKVITDYNIQANLYTLKEFVGEEGDVMDPYGNELMEYEKCYSELLRLIKKLIYKLEEKENN